MFEQEKNWARRDSGDVHGSWTREELSAVFHHEMRKAVFVDLGGLDAASANSLKTLSHPQGLLLSSFGDLFRHRCPPVELLQLTKQFAKLTFEDRGSSLPREMSMLLYYMSIAAALVRLRLRITRLSDSELLRGLGWALSYPSIDPNSRALLKRAVAILRSGAG